MDKKKTILVVVSLAVFLSAVILVNLLIRQYEQEAVTPNPKTKEKTVSAPAANAQKHKSKQRIEENINYEFPTEKGQFLQ